MTLIERIEAASGPDRELDAEIWTLVHNVPPKVARIDGHVEDFVPAYTASIDAAMGLVPEGWEIALYSPAESFPWCAQLETQDMRDRFAMEDEQIGGRGCLGSLALCAAALRARGMG